MYLKLRSKIIIFSSVVFFFFISSIIVSFILANKQFEKYFQEKEVEIISYLTHTFSNYYSMNGGWANLKGNGELFYELIEDGWSEESIKKNIKDKNKEEYYGFIRTIPYMKSLPSWDPLNMGPRINLLDKNKEYIAGEKEDSKKVISVLPIELEGKIIGWLSLKEGPKIIQPMEKSLKQNLSMLILINGSTFFLILLVIWIIFNIHILTPITKLIKASREFSLLKFKTRIPLGSHDEIGQLSRHFNEMGTKLDDYERRQKQWLNDISHELRTPLSMLMCEIEALKDEIQKPSKQLFVSLSNEIRHLVKLVNDIYDISLIDTEVCFLKKELLKPLTILIDNLYIFQKRLKSSDLSIDVEYQQEAVDLQIIGDYNRLKQLFTNILENSVRYTKKPGKLVIRQIKDADYIKFIFEDSGPGVPDDSLPKLFDRLYRVDSSRSRKTGGNGLGLAICKSIVKLHNGKIQAKNVENGGFMIEISLPIEKSGRLNKGEIIHKDIVKSNEEKNINC